MGMRTAPNDPQICRDDDNDGVRRHQLTRSPLDPAADER